MSMTVTLVLNDGIGDAAGHLACLKTIRAARASLVDARRMARRGDIDGAAAVLATAESLMDAVHASQRRRGLAVRSWRPARGRRDAAQASRRRRGLP